MQHRRRNISLYIVSDFIFSLVALILFYFIYPTQNAFTVDILNISIKGIETVLNLFWFLYFGYFFTLLQAATIDLYMISLG